MYKNQNVIIAHDVDSQNNANTESDLIKNCAVP